MSKFSKHRGKPIWKPKEGSLVLINANNIMVECGEVKDINGERVVALMVDGVRGFENVPVRDVIESIRSGSWRIIKDGPIEPEKVLREFKFL